MELVLRPAAAADIEEAFSWYEHQRKGLGNEFVAAVDAGLTEISHYPVRFPVHFRNTRRILLKRFPYAMFYRIYPDFVVVVACMHARRDPARWERR